MEETGREKKHMPLYLVREDITRMRVDAIVNAANSTLLGGGGVDGAIHRAAGPELLEACRTLGGCRTGEAKITPGFALPAAYVIHTVGPVWQGGGHGEREMLAACYRNSLLLAEEKGLDSVAFPLISSGAYGFPKDEALETAVGTVKEFLRDHEMNVTITVFDRESFAAGRERYEDLRAYIDDRYAETHAVGRPRRNFPEAGFAGNVPPMPFRSEALPQEAKMSAPRPAGRKKAVKAALQDSGAGECAAISDREIPAGLTEAVKGLDESFSETLLRKIDEKGMTDVACYKKANVDRKLFSKIRSDRSYRPGKPTALAFAIALELSLPETEDLLRKAGFALSPSSTFDVIIEYFIRNGHYDVYDINEALFAFDQPILC